MSYRSSVIKSMQRGTISLAAGSASATATLSTAVNTSYAYPLLLMTPATGATADSAVRVTLTNSTTVTAFHLGAAVTAVTVSFEVVEIFAWALRQAIQTGTVSHTAPNTSGTATIVAVNTTKAQLGYLGTAVTSNAGDTYPAAVSSTVALTNSTTVTGTRGSGSSSNVTIGFVVIDWK